MNLLLNQIATWHQIEQGAMYPSGTPNVQIDPNKVDLAMGNTGGYQSHNNMQPHLAIYYIIALYGVFPSRG